MRYGLPRSPSPSPVRRSVSRVSPINHTTAHNLPAIPGGLLALVSPQTLRANPKSPSAMPNAPQAHLLLSPTLFVLIQTVSHPMYPPRESRSCSCSSYRIPLMLTPSLVDTRSTTRREPRSPAERRHVEETVAAIRLRTRHHDPYEEWEKQTRKDALVRVSR